MKKSGKRTTKTRTHASAALRRIARARHSAQLRARIQGAIDTAVAPQVILDEIWQATDVDLDRLVDEYAASHYADGYRKPELQNRNINRAVDRGDDAVREVHEHMYSRFLMAADVGFELGFAAANRLSRGAR